MPRKRLKVALKFCGSCNPHISLSRLQVELASLAEGSPEFELVSGPPEKADTVIALCGCPRACAGREEPSREGPPRDGWLIVAGERLDGEAVPENRLAQAILKILSGRGEVGDD